MAAAAYQIEREGKAATLALSGDWTAVELGGVQRRLARDLKGVTPTRLDLTGLGRFDTSGALLLREALEGRALPAAAWKAKPEAGRIYAMVEGLEQQERPPAPRQNPVVRGLTRIGSGVYDFLGEAYGSFAFLGHLIAAVGRTVANPRRIRWAAWFSLMERAGLDAMPIVIVTNFFIGAVIAFLGADLLTQFGASVFAVDLISVAVFREFAVVITAVLLAGRSASAFAAEIGAMRMNQEIDAMEVMGVDPFEALVLPRLAALVIMLPLLTFAAILAGLFGGLLVTWAQLDLGPAFFIRRIYDYVPVVHLYAGLAKAPVFALIVAAIGCRQGMSVGGDVESLGRRVTAAVVHAIFAIIFIDAVFALIYLEMGV